MPIDAVKARRQNFNRIFKQKRKTTTTVVTGRQAEIEVKWDRWVKANSARARTLADEARALLQRRAPSPDPGK